MTPTLTTDEAARRRTGLTFGLSAYFMWGGIPLLFAAAQPSTPAEIVAQRVVWSLVFCVVILAIAGGFTRTWRLLRSPRILGSLALAAVLVSANWLAFVFGIETNRLVEVSLGYFFNPLISIGLGVVFLGEKLRPLQWVAAGIGVIAVLVVAIGYGRFPWLALAVALTFGGYGLVKNRVGGTVGALEGMTLETLILSPLALAYIAWLTTHDLSTFGTEGTGHALLLMVLGPATAIPLILFGAAARRVPLSWVGMMQYITPVMQFAIGVWVLGEAMPTIRWIGFFIVWIAVIVLTVDMLRASRTRRGGPVETV